MRTRDTAGWERSNGGGQRWWVRLGGRDNAPTHARASQRGGTGKVNERGERVTDGGGVAKVSSGWEAGGRRVNVHVVG